MKHIEIIIILALCMHLNSCYSQNKIAKKALHELLESIYENDSISSLKFSSTPYFHCKFQNDLEEKYYFVDIVLTQNSAENFCYDINTRGIKSYIYIEHCNDKPNKINPFFIPDARSWKFMIKNRDGNFVFYELKRFANIHNNSLEDTFEP